MKKKFPYKHPVLIFTVCALFVATVATLAIAQSNSAFNLNSPASFPVDI